MEQKKAPKADIEQRRTTGFLLGLIFVLSLFYVAMEWNSVPQQDGIDPLDLSDLMHESELVPMSNEETVTQLQEKQQVEKAEQLNIVDDEVELQHPDETLEGEGDDDETLLEDLQKEKVDKALAGLEAEKAANEAAVAAAAAKEAVQAKIDELLAQGKSLDDIMNLLG